MANKTLSVDKIRANGERGDLLTPYQIAKLINAKLVEVGLDEIRPQMMYNYDKNGLIVKGQKGIKEYTLAEADEFVEKFTAKRISKNQPVEVETVEDTEVEGQMDLFEDEAPELLEV